LVAVLLCAVPILAQQTQAPAPIVEAPPSAVIKVQTRLVNVFVNVADATGAPIGGLEKKDLQIFEDKKPETIAVFERQTETPLSVVMAIDTSGSMMKDAKLVREAAKQFVKDVIRPQDEMEVLEFAQSVTEIVPFTSDAKRIDEGLGELAEGQSTHLYDAVYLAGQNLAGRKAAGDGVRKRVIVMISDGDDTGHGTDYQHAVEQALRGEAMVYSIIVVPIAADAGRNTGGEHALMQMSADTGGKYYFAESPKDLKTAFAHISDDLRTQYLLGYYAPEHRPGTSFHTITVQMADPVRQDVNVLRYRSGYYTK
jgi:Ca-activated chloride channel family protein